MKAGKRMLALLLVLTMMLSMVPAAAAKGFEKSQTWSKSQFTDVSEDHWFYENVKGAYELGLMNGDPDGSFRPDGQVTLAETVAVASRIHAIHHLGEEKFVQGEVWYEIYVDYALQNGILETELSSYNRAATRLEFAEILSRALPESELKAINDVDDGAIPDVKENAAVYLLYRAGVLTGNDDKGTFAPQSSIKRSEVAAIVARMALPELRKEIALTAGPTIGNTSMPWQPEQDAKPLDPEDYLDENNAPTVPFDLLYPDVFESGEVDYSGEQILIKLAKDSGLSEALKAAGITAMEKIMEISSGVWYKAYVDGDVKTVMEAVRQIKEVLVAEYDFAYETEAITDSTEVDSDVHGNKDYADQWYLCSCGIQKGWGHLKHHHHHGPKPDDTDQGDENVGIAGEGVVVAVIDTGVDYNHEDLKDSMWVNRDEIPDNNIDDDKNGYVDDYYGYNAVADKGSGNDDNGHGTHVAGIIAAADNNLGIVGIAYNAEIMTIKAGMASGYFNQSDIAEAIVYAYKNGADVINMSFGGSASSIAVTDALEYAYTNCVLVAAAGNDGLPNEYVPGWPVLPTYPAALGYVLGVMSVDENGVESSFTNWDVKAFNSVEYELYAPGEAMLSTIPGNRYATWNGTSMAAPVVSAMAALLRAEFYDRSTYPTKFIYGQLSGTGTQTATCLDPKAHGKHNLPKIVDLYQAMTVLPKPEVGVSDYVIFDTPGLQGNEKNNGDGVIDAGETIAIGFTLRNRWGKTGETVVSVDTLSQAGISDPYVTILNNDVNYGSVGTYSTQDAGRIKNAGGLFIGWENPIYLQISPDCPNDYIIKLNVTPVSTNGLDETDTTKYVPDPIPYFLLDVRSAVILPNKFTEDTVLEGDKLYIIPNSTTIFAGATVTVEPGARIQFWGDDESDAYAQSAITYLKVEGNLIFNGTEENPIEIFPGQRFDTYRVEIYENNGGKVQMYHTKVTNPYLDITCAENCEFTQNYRSCAYHYRKLSSNIVQTYSDPTQVYIDQARDCAFYKLGGRYYPGSTGWSGSIVGDMKGRFDGCIFVDCALDFVRASSDYAGNQYQNCVFYGNNTYLGMDKGNVSTMTLSGANSFFNYEDTQIVVNEETGTTYIALRAADSMYGKDFPTVRAFAEYLGGTLVCINSQEELEFLRTNLSTDNHNYAIGLHKDSATGTVMWDDGTAFGEFHTINEDENWLGAYWTKLSQEREIETLLGTHGTSGKYLLELPGEIYVQDIVLGQEHLRLGSNKGAQIVASLEPATAVDALRYRSLDESIATVDETGFVTPVSVGETTIVISSSDGVVSVELPVTVVQHIAMESMELGKDIVVAVGKTHSLTPVLTPADTTERPVYASSDETVAKINSLGVIEGVAPGTAVITAVCEDNPSITDSITVTVVIPAESITAEEQLYVTNAAEAETVDVLGIKLAPADTTQTDLIWESSNPEIVDVDEAGNLIKNPNGGSATLRATVKGSDLYTEVTVILSEQDNEVTVVQMQRLDNSKYTFALLSDGTLWYWGDTVLVPTRLPFEQVAQFAVGEGINYYYLLLVDDAGTLNVYQTSSNKANFNFTLYNDVIHGSSVTGIVDVASFSTNSNGFFLYVDSNGAVWGWGFNGYGQLGINNKVNQSAAMQMQLPAGVKIVDVETTDDYASVMLASNGDLYYSGHNTSTRNALTPRLYASDVQAITPIRYTVQIETADQVQYGLFGITRNKLGDRMYYDEDSQWYLEDGVVYGRHNNGYGQLGLGDTNYRNDYEPMKKVTNASELFVLYNTVYIQTDDGRFYGVGRNNAHQIPNLSQGDQLVPSRIYFGLETMDAVPALESTNLTGNVLTDNRLLLDYDQGLQVGSNIASVTLKDSTGKRLSLTYEQKLDKLYVQPYAGFTAGETYTLTIPANALVNHFNVSTEALELTFTVAAAEETELLSLFSEDPDEVEEPRFVWTVEKLEERWESFLKNGESSVLRGCAILNRTEYMVDSDVERWLRIAGNSTSDYAQYPISGNYWGTIDPELINHQILDYDDYQSLVDINEGAYLTEAPEDVWPFVVKAGLLNADGEEVETVGNEKLTFFVDFNRDMDQTIELDVRFGSAYPYADYEVEGKWVSARRWEGETTLTTLIEGGYQFWSIANGRAADAPLKLYKDWGRFPFVIDTTAAQALILQGYATDEGVQLTWTQDDFDTLAGYNVYRAHGSEDAQYVRLNATIIPSEIKSFMDDNVAPGEVYFYNFTVVKTDLSESEPSGRTRVLSKDTIPPSLIHTPVNMATKGRNLAISATVTDNLSLNRVTLYYRNAGDADWQSVDMANLNDKYSAIVAGNTLQTAGLEYYIEAFDGISCSYKGSAEAPYRVTVREETDTDAKGDFDGDGTITILDAYQLLQAASGRLNADTYQHARGDLDGDGYLTAAEALKVLKYVNGEIGSLQ